MQSACEQYKSGCQMISLLTNLEVQLFDHERVSQIHYASYDLPTVIERYKQAALTHILQQPLVKEHVYVFRDSIQLEFLAAGIWDGPDYRGTIVVGPWISKAYPPQVLSEIIHKERLPLLMQQQLHQCYNTLTMVDESKLQAVSYLLINVFTPGMIQPQQIEIALPPSEGTAVKFNDDLEQDRELIEGRYANENKLLHAITRGDPHKLKIAMEEGKELSWPYRHPNSPVRSMKNLSFSANTLCRKAAERGEVHPLYLDSISGKFAIQIEQAQSRAELVCLYEEMLQTYCNLVRELSVAALSSLIKDAVTTIRFTIDQPLSLNRLAQTLGVHPSYLSRTFKKELGMTLTEYINKLRIEEAKYMLDSSNASVATIALSVGYNDANYFSKVFQKREQVTPHEYRQQKRGMHSLCAGAHMQPPASLCSSTF
jgi:two-component system, response regulator YesN